MAYIRWTFHGLCQTINFLISWQLSVAFFPLDEEKLPLPVVGKSTFFFQKMHWRDALNQGKCFTRDEKTTEQSQRSSNVVVVQVPDYIFFKTRTWNIISSDSITEGLKFFPMKRVYRPVKGKGLSIPYQSSLHFKLGSWQSLFGH